MTESNVIHNLLNYISQIKVPPANPVQIFMMSIQAAMSCGEFGAVTDAIARLKGIAASSGATAAEPLKKFIGEAENITGDKEWTASEYKQKSLLGKVNIFFQDCFENITLNLDDPQLASFYLEFVRTRLDLEYGYSFLAIARYFMARGNYDPVFPIIETVINRFPDSTYEFLALCDLLEIYKLEFDALERNAEDYADIVEKIVQILFYIIKKHSYQTDAFARVMKFSPVAFRYTNDKSARSFLEKVNAAFSDSVHEEDIKLNFVNYYIGRNKLEDALKYLGEYCEVFPKTTRLNVINLYRFECYIRRSDCARATEALGALEEKSLAESPDTAQKLYSLLFDHALLLEKSGQFKEAISSHEKVYKGAPLKKLREDALYKLINLNVGTYFTRRENMPEDAKIIVRGYCNSFLVKFPKSKKAEEVRLVLESLNSRPQRQSEPAASAPADTGAAETPAAKRSPDAERILPVPARTEKAEGAVAQQPGHPRKKSRVDRERQPQQHQRSAAAPVAGPEKSAEAAIPGDSIDRTLEKASSEEGPDIIKYFLYLAIAAAYAYAFLVLPTSTMGVFYAKMVMSFIPVLLACGTVFYSVFKMIGIFE